MASMFLPNVASEIASKDYIVVEQILIYVDKCLICKTLDSKLTWGYIAEMDDIVVEISLDIRRRLKNYVYDQSTINWYNNMFKRVDGITGLTYRPSCDVETEYYVESEYMKNAIVRDILSRCIIQISKV